MDINRKPGEILEIKIDDFPSSRTREFSSHVFPPLNLLKSLHDEFNVEITIVACQIEKIPKSVNPGLSKPVNNSVSKAAKLALKLLKLKR